MTAQMCDKINVENQEYLLYSEPLESFWNEFKPKPDFEPPHTACWRGYITSWKVEDSKLFLTGIETENENLELEKVFPGKNTPLFADWFSGELRVPKGEMTQYIHMGYESKYESDLFLIVDNGLVINEHLINNR